jgi:hypothetical protein
LWSPSPSGCSRATCVAVCFGGQVASIVPDAATATSRSGIQLALIDKCVTPVPLRASSSSRVHVLPSSALCVRDTGCVPRICPLPLALSFPFQAFPCAWRPGASSHRRGRGAVRGRLDVSTEQRGCIRQPIRPTAPAPHPCIPFPQHLSLSLALCASPSTPTPCTPVP